MKNHSYNDIEIIIHWYPQPFHYNPTDSYSECHWTTNVKPKISSATIDYRIGGLDRLRITLGSPAGHLCKLALAYVDAKDKQEAVRLEWNWQSLPKYYTCPHPETKEDYACLAVIGNDEWSFLDLAQLVPCSGTNKSVKDIVEQATIQDLEEIVRIVKDDLLKNDGGVQ